MRNSHGQMPNAAWLQARLTSISSRQGLNLRGALRPSNFDKSTAFVAYGYFMPAYNLPPTPLLLSIVTSVSKLRQLVYWPVRCGIYGTRAV